jgi:hypothetical protein
MDKITISSKMDLLELIQKPNISYKLASKIATQYLNVLDVTQNKEMLIQEVKRMVEIDHYSEGLYQSILLGNPLREYES